MLTTGGFLLGVGDRAGWSASGIESMSFFCPSKDAMNITTPPLTFREMWHLNSLLPNRLADLAEGLLPPGDVEGYAAIYRYFPAFADTDL